MKTEYFLEPTKWYSPSEARNSIPEISEESLSEDRHQVRIRFRDALEGLLGATVLNYALRRKYLNLDELPEEVRLVDPISFAQALEVPARSLCNYRSRKLGSGEIPLIQEVEIDGEIDYRVDVASLHLFSLPNVDHRLIHEQYTTLPQSELIEKYRLSGGNDDLFSIIKRRFDKTVRSVAEEMKAGLPGTITLEDLIAAGWDGFRGALDKFDLDRGVKLTTYARPRIKGAILDSLRKDDPLPRSLRARISPIRDFVASYRAEHEEDPSPELIKEKFGLGDSDFRDLENLAYGNDIITISLDEELSREEGGSTRVEQLTYENEMGFETRIEINEIVSRAIETLDSSEREVVNHYFFGGLTLLETAVRLGVTESRVCQILGRATQKLKGIKELRELSWQ